MVVVRGIKENLFVINHHICIRWAWHRHTIWTDAVLQAQLTPKLGTNLISTLATLKCEKLARHSRQLWVFYNFFIHYSIVYSNFIVYGKAKK